MCRCDGIVIAGTTEGRQVIEALNRKGLKLAVTVATTLGRQVLDGVEGMEATEVFVGRRDEQGFCQLFERLAPVFVVDASHPFAVEVSRTVRAACAAKNVRYIRYVRPEGQGQRQEQGAASAAEGAPELRTGEPRIGEPRTDEPRTGGFPPVYGAADAHEAAALIREIPGNILLTTGANTVRTYAQEIPDFNERCYIRVLDTELSRKGCRDAGVPESHVIAVNPPFSCEDNVKLIGRYSIKALVSKDSGAAGGLPEKLAAARQTGIPVILIRRPVAEDVAAGGMYFGECACVESIEELLALVERVITDQESKKRLPLSDDVCGADDARRVSEVYR